MKIQYQNRVVGSIPPADQWLDGDLQPIPSGSYSIEKVNGRYLRVNPTSDFDETDNIEPLAAFEIDSQNNVVRVGYGDFEHGPRYAIRIRYVA